MLSCSHFSPLSSAFPKQQFVEWKEGTEKDFGRKKSSASPAMVEESQCYLSSKPGVMGCQEVGHKNKTSEISLSFSTFMCHTV